ncbi:hypothetical protein M2R47_08655 [Moraxella sp. Tifton1]|nr:hypothetical protein [Moraxella sp. Tifton1]MCL1624303.1 hypothetical protein [Moraxella sp. Tifton1]
MCELSLNEIGMVSGGVHDDKGGGGSGSSLSLGMAGSMGAGVLGGAANYGASTLAGGKEFDMMDAAVAVSGGALSGSGFGMVAKGTQIAVSSIRAVQTTSNTVRAGMGTGQYLVLLMD